MREQDQRKTERTTPLYVEAEAEMHARKHNRTDLDEEGEEVPSGYSDDQNDDNSGSEGGFGNDD